MTIIPHLISADDAIHDEVPPIFHFVWVGAPVAKFAQEYWGQWREIIPDQVQIMTWTDSNAELWPLANLLRDKVHNPVILADLVRLEVLSRYGGVYLDSDIQPLRDPSQALTRRSAWVESIPADRQGGRKANNAAFGMPPKHPILQYVWQHAVAHLRFKDAQNVAGPRVWQAGVDRFNVPLLETPRFPGLPTSQRLKVLTYTREQLAARFPEAFGVHEYQHDWVKKARKVHND